MKTHKTTLLTISSIILLFSIFYLLNKNKKDRLYQSVLSNSISDLQIKEDFFYNNFNTGSIMNGLYAPDIISRLFSIQRSH